ncbi:MAG: hypothetical protein SF053_12055 [Bacteroidia bacterium]|nr:hypothetical protein [Bacteroidia bacterium]
MKKSWILFIGWLVASLPVSAQAPGYTVGDLPLDSLKSQYVAMQVVSCRRYIASRNVREYHISLYHHALSETPKPYVGPHNLRNLFVPYVLKAPDQTWVETRGYLDALNLMYTLGWELKESMMPSAGENVHDLSGIVFILQRRE